MNEEMNNVNIEMEKEEIREQEVNNKVEQEINRESEQEVSKSKIFRTKIESLLKNTPKKKLIAIGAIVLVAGIGISFVGKRVYAMNKNKTAISFLDESVKDYFGEGCNVSYNFFNDTIDIDLIEEGFNVVDLKEEIKEDTQGFIEEGREMFREMELELSLYGAVSDCRLIACSGYVDGKGKIQNREPLLIMDEDGIEFTKASGLDLELEF